VRAARAVHEKLIKIGAKVVSHGRYAAFQMAEVAISRNLFADILRLIVELRPPPVMSTAEAFSVTRSIKNNGRLALKAENSPSCGSRLGAEGLRSGSASRNEAPIFRRDAGGGNLSLARASSGGSRPNRRGDESARAFGLRLHVCTHSGSGVVLFVAMHICASQSWQTRNSCYALMVHRNVIAKR
jgi:hypothetical protein